MRRLTCPRVAAVDSSQGAESRRTRTKSGAGRPRLHWRLAEVWSQGARNHQRPTGPVRPGRWACVAAAGQSGEGPRGEATSSQAGPAGDPQPGLQPAHQEEAEDGFGESRAPLAGHRHLGGKAEQSPFLPLLEPGPQPDSPPSACWVMLGPPGPEQAPVRRNMSSLIKIETCKSHVWASAF